MGIDEFDSAISDRKFRHNLAHLDERLDDRVASTSGSIARANIASRQTFAHVKDEDIFELFDPDDGKLYFRGDVFDLRQALACVQSIHNKARDYGARTIGFSMF